MSFKTTYQLIQQTPMIHFQHDQDGATLRATEVKPKLDRFIMEKLLGKDNLKDKLKKFKETHRNWFVDDTNALNYKMKIVATGTPTKSNTIDLTLKINKTYDDDQKRKLNNQLKAQINSMYFGNMASKKENDYEENVRTAFKETVFYEKNTPVLLEITCFVDGIINIIDKYIEEFFFVNNFGTRQSKGFGGFIAIKTGEENKAKDPIKTLSEQGYSFFYADVNGDTSYTAMMNHAKNVYAVMKGGYNDTRWNESSECYRFENRYIKGYIQRAFIDEFINKDAGSDKAFIKSKKNIAIDKQTNKPFTYSEKRHGQPNEYKYDEYVFVRALFGLADYYEFRDVRKGRVEIFSLGEKGFDVERFRSPITIKIIDNKLIFLFGSFKNICGKTFHFAPNGIPDKKAFDKKNESEKVNYIRNNPNVFVKISTIDKFDDEDIICFINAFYEYFMKQRSIFAEFNDESISNSANLKLIVPEHVKRSV